MYVTKFGGVPGTLEACTTQPSRAGSRNGTTNEVPHGDGGRHDDVDHDSEGGDG
jgi:hypothetical protein